MIREVIRPQHDDFTIKIPKEYINKKVEFIMFLIDEPEPIAKTDNQQKDNDNIITKKGTP